MSTSNLYYEPPSDEVFDELKAKAVEIWKTYDDTHGYASGKIERIKPIGNTKDNFMYMVAMFDSTNQQKLAAKLSDEARKAVHDRMIAGGAMFSPFGNRS